MVPVGEGRCWAVPVGARWCQPVRVGTGWWNPVRLEMWVTIHVVVCRIVTGFAPCTNPPSGAPAPPKDTLSQRSIMSMGQ